MKMPKIHKYAELFPPASAEDSDRILTSLEKNGQMQKLVTLDGELLDGVNRANLLINKLKTEPEYIDYWELPAKERGQSPLDFVKARNFDRRQMNKSQRAAVAADWAEMFEAEMKQIKADGEPTDPTSQETGHRPEDETQAPSRKRSSAGTVAAAEAFGVSPRQVERAKAVKAKHPRKHAAIKAGKTTLTKAERDEKKAKATEQEHTEAIRRVGAVCGSAMMLAAKAGEILKGKELRQFTSMSDADMQKTKGLISAGWKVSKAKSYKQTTLGLNNKIGELITRAMAQGAGQKGVFAQEFKHSFATFEISVRLAK